MSKSDHQNEQDRLLKRARQIITSRTDHPACIIQYVIADTLT